MLRLWILVFLWLKFSHCCYGSVFSAIINRHYYGGVLASFADFNADKMVDIFVISTSGERIDVLLSDPEKQFIKQNLINSSFPSEFKISRVMLADFNADFNMDLLVIRRQAESDATNIEVYWGENDKISVNQQPFMFNETFKDDPVIFDYNADMLPDLLVETERGHRIVWQSTTDGSFSAVLNVTTTTPLTVPNSCAFLEVDGVPGSDLVLTVRDGSKYKYEVYSHGNLSNSAPTKVYHFTNSTPLSSTFGDFNQDGVIDHIVPTCSGETCSIFVYCPDSGTDRWCQMLSTKANELSFNPIIEDFHIPAKVHVGDYDMDGYPDGIVVMSSEKKQRAFLLHNVPCDEHVADCKMYGRMFHIEKGELSSVQSDVVVATFFDFEEDGTLDIAMTVKDSNGTLKLIFLKNNLAEDTCFLKVTVLGGVCTGKCSNQPYGVIYPGPTVNYTTTKTNGLPQKCAAGQLSQSSHFALQLPYVIFGLGQTPNFVDHVGIRVQQNSTSVKLGSREWQQIIPNSQLIVLTSPVDDPLSWKMKLYVRPSKKLWLTGIALASTCGLVALIVAALHLQERSEDNKEKKQESQKFHFDAM